jgi:hypothetical protein
MKSVLKIKKITNNYTISKEDSMNLNSQMLKKEKDFLQFIRQKLNPKKSNKENPDIDSTQESNQKKAQAPIPAQKGKV